MRKSRNLELESDLETIRTIYEWKRWEKEQLSPHPRSYQIKNYLLPIDPTETMVLKIDKKWEQVKLNPFDPYFIFIDQTGEIYLTTPWLDCLVPIITFHEGTIHHFTDLLSERIKEIFKDI